jgi:lipoprotein-releasing system permease protein
MGYPLELALRYLGSRKRAAISVGTAFAVLGVTLGVAALATIMSVTGGFHQQFREKVLGVNAHVLVLKFSTNFREYRTVMEKVAGLEGVVGVAPFIINPMMITHGDATATGVLVKGVDPRLSLGVRVKDGDEWGERYAGLEPVLDLPKYVVAGSLEKLRLSGARPPAGKLDPWLAPEPPPDAPLVPAPPPLPPAPTATPSAAPPVRGTKPEARLPEAAPTGAGPIEPEGGYRSVLPDDDVLPPELEIDPCADPAAIDNLPGIVVGAALADTLALAHTKRPDGSIAWKLDDCVTITSPTIGFSFSSGTIKPPVAKRFRVVGVFEAGFDQYDSKLVYVDLYEAQVFYDHGDTVTGVEMKVRDIEQASDVADRVATTLSSGVYHTMDWYDLNRGLFTALRIQQISMSAVLALIIVVAAFTVVATLIMVVLDKTREISVLKAMGASDYGILRVFVYQGGIIGLGGTALGLLLGWGVCEGLLAYGFPLDPKVYFISRLPVLVRPIEFVITGAISLAICLLATIIPSLYAARLGPAEGFRRH